MSCQVSHDKPNGPNVLFTTAPINVMPSILSEGLGVLPVK